MKCPECSGKVQFGIAICPEQEYGAIYLMKPPPLKNEDINLIKVYKCINCGYSCDDEYDLKR